MTDQIVEETHTTENEPEIPPTRVTGNSDPKMFTQEDLDRAREQEKSKVYKRLETMQETIARLESESRARQEQEEAARKEAEQRAEKERLESLSARELIEEKEAQWRREQEELRQQIETERALRERESQFAELMAVRQQIVTEYQDRVAPELLDLITGDTPEQIQQSAEDMAQRTERILAQTQEAMQNARQQMPTARVTAPASGANAESVRSFTPEQLRDMSMAEYAKHRASLIRGGTKNRGLLG